jgi:sugar phosphate permease
MGRPPAAPPTRVRYAVLATLCAAALLAYVQRSSIGVAEGALRADLGLTMTQSGAVMSAFFLTYAVLQIPAGCLGHVWGSRRGLPLFTALSSLAGALGAAGGLPALLASRLALGAAQAGQLPCAAGSVARWLPAGRRGLASGALGSSLSVGAALGAWLTGLLLAPLGWRLVFALYAVPGLVWSVWFFLWFRDRPQDHPGVNPAELDLIRAGGAPADGQEEPTSPGPGPAQWGAILTSPPLLCVCGQQFFRAAGYVFYASWFTTYLVETRGLSVARAGLLTSLPLLCVVAGGVLGGWLSDWLLARTGSRRVGRQGLAVVSQAVCGLLILLARPVADPWAAVALLGAGSFCAALGGPCAYATTIDLGGQHVAPVFSTMNMAGNLGALAFPLVVPWLVAAGGWDLALLAFAGVHVAAAGCWLLLDPNRPLAPVLPRA